MKRLSILALMFVAGCATAPLTAEEQSVRIYRKSDPPASCQEVKKVISSGLAAFSDQGREDNLRRAAFKVGGNAVTEDRRDVNATIYGTAYHCP